MSVIFLVIFLDASTNDLLDGYVIYFTFLLLLSVCSVAILCVLVLNSINASLFLGLFVSSLLVSTGDLLVTARTSYFIVLLVRPEWLSGAPVAPGTCSSILSGSTTPLVSSEMSLFLSVSFGVLFDVGFYLAGGTYKNRSGWL